MLEKYQPAINTFGPGVARAVTVIFDLPARASLYEELEDAGWTQADLVVELLRLDLIPEVEALLGHPITRCPGYKYRPLPVLPRDESPDARRVRSVVPDNPRLPSTPSYQRFALIRPGQTVGSLLRRGLTRRDIREALRNKWMELGQ